MTRWASTDDDEFNTPRSVKDDPSNSSSARYISRLSTCSSPINNDNDNSATMKFTSLFVTATALFGLASAAPSPSKRELEANAADLADPKANFNFSPLEAALNTAFSQIEAIPDSVLESGDEATAAWLKENPFEKRSYAEVRVPLEGRDDVSFLSERGIDWAKVAKCVATVTSAIATNVIPAAKLLKIKKYIAELGGVKSAIQLLIGATTTAEKLKAGGQALVELSKLFLGVTAIEAACF